MSGSPIIMSPPMVRALLAGTKTQTRRMVKPQPVPFMVDEGQGMQPCEVALEQDIHDPFPRIRLGRVITTQALRYRRHQPLWVREQVRAEELASGHDGVRYLADDEWRKIENTKNASREWLDLYHYHGGPEAPRLGKRVPPMHMPRWASRLTLHVTEVRLERLCDISEDDARAEGIEPMAEPTGAARALLAATGVMATWLPYRSAYANLWNALHGDGAWEANPYVTAVTFTVERQLPARLTSTLARNLEPTA